MIRPSAEHWPRAIESLVAYANERPNEFQAAVALIKEIQRNPRPVPLGDQHFFRATEPLWRDPDVVGRLTEEERQVWARVAHAQAEALKQRRGRPRDPRREVLTTALATLASEQAGAPLHAECARIIAAVFDVARPPRRGRRARRLQAERHRRRLARRK